MLAIHTGQEREWNVLPPSLREPAQPGKWHGIVHSGTALQSDDLTRATAGGIALMVSRRVQIHVSSLCLASAWPSPHQHAASAP